MSANAAPRRRRLSIASSDKDELSQYFSDRVSKVSISPIAPDGEVSIAATIVAVDDVVAFKSSVPTGARYRQGEDLDGYLLQLATSGKAAWKTPSGVFACTKTKGFIGRLGEREIFDCSQDWSQIALRLDQKHLTRSLAQLLDRPVTKPIEFATEFDRRNANVDTLTSLIQLTVSNDAFLSESPLAAGHFAECVTLFILENLKHNYSEKLSANRLSIQPKYVKRAIEFMRSNAERSLSLQEVAKSAGISVRTLHYGFKHFLDQSPYEYLKLIRLEAAHAELLVAPREVSTGSIARKWGFQNPGRFAAHCHRHYGRTPAEIRLGRRRLLGP